MIIYFPFFTCTLRIQDELMKYYNQIGNKKMEEHKFLTHLVYSITIEKCHYFKRARSN